MTDFLKKWARKCNQSKALLGAVCVFLLSSCEPIGNRGKIVVVSYNIRYDNAGDGDNRWSLRKDDVAERIIDNNADFAGLQEVLASQLDTLGVRLEDYHWTGVGRTDGIRKGEYSPIFYRSDRFEIEDGGTFWLSETPDSAGSRGWDAALPRIATWGRFRDIIEDRSLYVFNTHFDHIGEIARQQSANLIKDRITSIASGLPVILTGDFNSLTTDLSYAFLARRTDHSVLYDARLSSPDSLLSTFRGFERNPDQEKLIDYVFLNDGFDILTYKIDETKRTTAYPSDHLPVVVSAVYDR